MQNISRSKITGGRQYHMVAGSGWMPPPAGPDVIRVAFKSGCGGWPGVEDFESSLMTSSVRRH
jgi:hypothetical protein